MAGDRLAGGGTPLRVFVSVAGPDRPWARWIGQQLRRAGHSVELDEWSWQAGTSFLANIDAALAAADRVVAVVSPAYLDPASYGREEREAALRLAHTRDGLLVPVLVAPTVLSPLLGRLAHVDLTGLGEQAARTALLEAVAGRRPPDLAVDMPFPGAATASAAVAEPDVAFPGPGEGHGPAGSGGSGVVAGPARGRTAVGVVHLSDLRFGAADSPADAGLANRVVEHTHRLGLIPDLLVATGDLTEHGLPSEFRQALGFLADLVGRLGLSRQRVALVPGDRDVNHLGARGTDLLAVEYAI